MNGPIGLSSKSNVRIGLVPLAKQGINVEAMETDVESAPMTATPLFQMEAQLNVPPSLTIEDLCENLAPK